MNYFAYGSNMDKKRMEKRGVTIFSMQRARLEGFRLAFNKVASRRENEGYANIVEDPEGVVEGVLYEIKDSDIKELDFYEGCPCHYLRIKVTVKLDNGQEVTAVTYVANPDKIRDGLKPSKEYLNHLLAGKDYLSPEYFERLKATETID
jgi:cation transport regulator ChaC